MFATTGLQVSLTHYVVYMCACVLARGTLHLWLQIKTIIQKVNSASSRRSFPCRSCGGVRQFTWSSTCTSGRKMNSPGLHLFNSPPLEVSPGLVKHLASSSLTEEQPDLLSNQVIVSVPHPTGRLSNKRDAGRNVSFIIGQPIGAQRCDPGLKRSQPVFCGDCWVGTACQCSVCMQLQSLVSICVTVPPYSVRYRNLNRL